MDGTFIRLVDALHRPVHPGSPAQGTPLSAASADFPPRPWDGRGQCHHGAVYGLVYRVLLRRLPAETAHAAGFWLIRAAGALPGGPWLLRRWLAPRDPVLRVRALGLDLPGPLGLAAGFDKDARGADALGALGFAFVEVGTVTAQAQPGNPQPRMFRLPADRARGEPDGLQQRGRGGRGGTPARRDGPRRPGRQARRARRPPAARGRPGPVRWPSG